MNDMHEANRRRWDHASAQWARGADSRGLWKPAFTNPRVVLLDQELTLLGEIRGKRLCVLGSGDNQTVFAFAGMGADVTSVDISEEQLNVAQRRAAELGANITFIRADVTDLSAIASSSFDLVYTGGHVAVWVSDLQQYYSEATRILKPAGLFVVSEYHPFRRVWKGSAWKLELDCGYFERGPHVFDYTSDILVREPGEHRAYEFHWTVSDYIMAVQRAGNTLVSVQEVGDENEGWESAPMKGLPQVLLIGARKAK